MADCSKQFRDFLSKIELSDSQIEKLRINRESLRSDIKSYFKANDLAQPDFCWQGSFSMGTIIKDPNNEYDFDDGIYLNHLPESKKDWPSTERIHELIVKAVDGHTSKRIENKKKCIRVPYSDNHHVDLAIYGQYDNKYYLAVKGETQWEDNNAKAFKEWFDSKKSINGIDFVNVICTLKKWAKIQDYKNISGFYITILVGNSFVYNERFDLCLKNTLAKILTDLKTNYSIIRPVDPKINVTAEKFQTAEDFKKFIIDPFQLFYDIACKAIDDTSLHAASKKWQGLFGTDFSVCEEQKENSINISFDITSTPRPWGNYIG